MPPRSSSASRPPLQRRLSGLLRLALVTGGAALAAAASMMDAASANAAGAPGIEVVDGGWGGGQPAEIRKVIAAVVEVFPRSSAERSPAPGVRIRHRFGGPLISYDRDRDGSVSVYLSARDDRWYQYVYQFAHEHCHLLAHFDRKQLGHEIVGDHQWFEESLCETASLYALRRLARTWCDGATRDPALREAGAQLAQYARQLLDEPHRRLAPGTDLAAWYARHRDTLSGKPYLRELNELAAARLLPLFEADPNRWAALAFLHPAQPSPGQSFPAFLAAWGAASPPELRPLVAEIQTLFGISAIAAAGSASDRPTGRIPARPDTGTGCGS